jgi:hypothetical protein
MVGDLAGK